MWVYALYRVDFLGNLIFIPSWMAIFLGLIIGGSHYPWSLWRVILPLAFGSVGWLLFHVHQSSAICTEPSMPPRLFKYRTSAVSFVITFLGAVVLQAIAYFLPIYFQGIRGTSPLVSSIYFLSFALVIILAGAITRLVMSKWGSYKYLHWLGFGLNAVGYGMLSVLD